ncbi:MAG: HEPN domain-containing protein [Deltaproteobacteria bacterium]|nr:HEPN domain-containing protein [Deltaproteobacteria bacterium]
MKEIDGLLERTERYVKSAKLLIKDKDYESAVSRSYYAMFYAAEALLLSKGLSFSSHKAVISAFGEHFVKTNIFKKDMSKMLTRAFEKRQIGDYEFTFVITGQEAGKLLKDAQDFAKIVKRYLIELGKEEVVEEK